MQRPQMVLPMLALVLVAALLLAESWLPGQVFLPLSLDDFPAWSAGKTDGALVPHPHPNWTMSDVLHLMLPGLAVTKEALSRGELPLWDPSQALGLPHIDQVHHSVLYPPAWIPLSMGLDGLAVLAWLHLVIAGTGMLLYLRSIGRSTVAMTAGTLAFVCSAWITARLHSFPVVGAAVWMPWVLWGLQRGAETGRARYRLYAAVALALSMLAGFPQVTLLVASTAGLLELVRLACGLSKPKAAIMRCGAGLASLALGGALAAMQVLPTLQYMGSESARAEQDLEQLAASGLEWPMMAHLVAPDYLADAGLPGLHPMALRDVEQASQPAAVNRAETSMGVGVIALILALLTMIFGRTMVSRTWTFIVVVVFTLLLWPELLAEAAAILPPLQYGNPKRLLLVSTFGLSVLAAGGVDVLRRPFLRITSLGWLFSFAFAGWAVWLMIAVPSTATSGDVDNWAMQIALEHGLENVFPEEVYDLTGIPPESFVQASAKSFHSTLIALLASLTGLLFFRPKTQETQAGWSSLARQAPAVLTAALTLELMMSAFPLLRSVHDRAITSDSAQLTRLRASTLVGLVRACANEPGVPPRMARVGNDPSFLRPNFPGLFGLHDLQAYAPMAPKRTMELLGSIAPATVINGSQIGGFTSAEELNSPIVDMLGVAAVLTQNPDLMPDGFSEVGVLGHVRVLGNDEVFPRAWTLTDVTVVEVDGVRLNRLNDSSFDPRLMAVLDQAIEWPPGEFFLADPPSESEQDEVSADESEASEDGEGDASEAAELVTSQMPEDMPEDPAEDAPLDTPEDAPQDTPEELSEATPQDLPEDTPEDTPEDMSDDSEGDDGTSVEPGEEDLVSEEGLPGKEDEEALRDQDEFADEEELDGDDTASDPEDRSGVEPFGPRSVVIDSYLPGRIELQVGPGPDSVLIVAESWNASWVGEVDGLEVPVTRANHVCMALPVPAGEEGSTITLEYIERGPLLGLAVGAVALALFIGGVFYTRRRKGPVRATATGDSAA